jgi:hypothetical protein
MDPIAHTCSGILIGQGLCPQPAVRPKTLLVAGLKKRKGVGSLYSGRVESGRKRSAETSGFPDTRVEPLAAITGGEENILASRNKGV